MSPGPRCVCRPACFSTRPTALTTWHLAFTPGQTPSSAPDTTPAARPYPISCLPCSPPAFNEIPPVSKHTPLADERNRLGVFSFSMPAGPFPLHNHHLAFVRTSHYRPTATSPCRACAFLFSPKIVTLTPTLVRSFFRRCRKILWGTGTFAGSDTRSRVNFTPSAILERCPNEVRARRRAVRTQSRAHPGGVFLVVGPFFVLYFFQNTYGPQRRAVAKVLPQYRRL